MTERIHVEGVNAPANEESHDPARTKDDEHAQTLDCEPPQPGLLCRNVGSGAAVAQPEGDGVGCHGGRGRTATKGFEAEETEGARVVVVIAVAGGVLLLKFVEGNLQRTF